MWGSTFGCIVMLTLSMLVASLVAEAQQATKVHRIGLLHPFSPPPPSESDSRAEAFRQGLHDLGYVEGQNLVIEIPYGQNIRTRCAIGSYKPNQGK